MKQLQLSNQKAIKSYLYYKQQISRLSARYHHRHCFYPLFASNGWYYMCIKKTHTYWWTKWKWKWLVDEYCTRLSRHINVSLRWNGFIKYWRFKQVNYVKGLQIFGRMIYYILFIWKLMKNTIKMVLIIHLREEETGVLLIISFWLHFIFKTLPNIEIIYWLGVDAVWKEWFIFEESLMSTSNSKFQIGVRGHCYYYQTNNM